MNQLTLGQLFISITNHPGYIDVNLHEKANFHEDISKPMGFIECMKNNRGVFEMFPITTYERHRGLGNIVLATMYQKLKSRNIDLVYASGNISTEYTDLEYDKFIKQIGFRKTWISYLFGGNQYYAKIPNAAGDAFSDSILSKYNFVANCGCGTAYSNFVKSATDGLPYKLELVNQPNQTSTSG